MDHLAHPFTIGADGRIATVTDGSDQAHAQHIAALLLTRRGERPLVPAFGTTDPAFGEVDRAELAVALDTFGPDVTLVEVTTDYPDEPGTGVAVTVVEFT